MGLRRNDSPTPCYGAIYAFRPSSYQAGGQPYTGVHDWAISGTNTGMSNPGQLAVDSSNNVILAQTYDSDELVYAVAASGNVAPSLTIPGPSIPSGCNYGYVDGLSAYSGGIIVSWSGETCSYVALYISTGFTYSVTGGTSSQTFQLQGIQNATVDAYGNLAGFTPPTTARAHTRTSWSRIRRTSRRRRRRTQSAGRASYSTSSSGPTSVSAVPAAVTSHFPSAKARSPQGISAPR